MQENNYNNLSPEEENIIVFKGTEKAFSGKYFNFYEKGIYLCKRCNNPLFASDSKFNSGCGWPSFDDELPNTVKKQTDRDNLRTEILCAKCDAHLGHIFFNEGFTNKNKRYCVNSLSLNFIPAKTKTDTAFFAAGCFWGVEYYFKKLKGVLDVSSGYTGGNLINPGYKDVCSGKTGHYEAVQITYNPEIINYEELVKYFFEIHDFSQMDGQGPDIGEQYLSAIFFNNENQKIIADKIITLLKEKKYFVATAVLPFSKFWYAEDYHQDYYQKTGKTPYCHSYKKIF
ncbi:MAG: bifunctional methionine sulfoxide reductase B/A protein [Bacteroidales bacterium]|nr:bifunctional methionine sulfoxide reductase B/A protein [Bacteroidales bacterium]